MQTVMECGEWLLRRKVLPQHADHAGVMWHGAYLAWLEEARIEALASVGLAYSDLSSRGLEMPVVRVRLDFRRVLAHGDQVDLCSSVLPLVGVRLPWASRFYGSNGALAAEAKVDVVLARTDDSRGQDGLGRLRLVRKWPRDLLIAVEALQRGQA